MFTPLDCYWLIVDGAASSGTVFEQRIVSIATILLLSGSENFFSMMVLVWERSVNPENITLEKCHEVNDY